jgi:hypothetical protein
MIGAAIGIIYKLIMKFYYSNRAHQEITGGVACLF